MHRFGLTSKPQGRFPVVKPMANVLVGRPFLGRRLPSLSRVQHHQGPLRQNHVVVRALFGFRRKKKKSQPAEVDEVTVTAGEKSELNENETSSQREAGISVEPPPTPTARSIGGLAVKGLVFGVALFGLYLFVKDFMQLDEKNKSDFRQVLREVNQIRKGRGRDPMSAQEESILIERCTELLLSLEQKSPVAAVQLAISMLGMNEVTDAEKQSLTGAFHDFDPVPKLKNSAAIPGRVVMKTKAADHASEPDSEPIEATVLPENESRDDAFRKARDEQNTGDGDLDMNIPVWWSGLPYVCVLVAKSCNGMLMLSDETGEQSGFCIVGFEDPQEAQIAKRCLAHDPFVKLNPFRQSRSQVLEELGVKPADVKHWKAQVDSTWLSPKEFDGILYRTKSEAMVVPAGTLRGVGEKFTDVQELVRLIRKACRSEETPEVSADTTGDDSPEDLVEAVPVDLPTPSSNTSSTVQSAEESSDSDPQSAPSPEPKSYIDGSFLSGEPIDVSVFNVPKSDPEGGFTYTPVSKAKERSKMDSRVLPRFEDNGVVEKGSGGGVPPDVSSTIGGSDNSERCVGGFDDPDLERFGTSISNGASEASTSVKDPNGGNSNSSARREPPRKKAVGGLPWWTGLNAIHIPQVKQAGEKGGAVEVNFAVIPDYTDYRLVLFEDKRDAEQFLGVFGSMVGEEAMVGVSTMEPRRFLATTSESKLKNVVVLGKGTMMVSREMNYQQVVGSIRFATQCTAREHGEVVEQNIPWEMEQEAGAEDVDLDGSMKGAAEDMIAEMENMLKQGGWDREDGVQKEGDDSEDSFANFLDGAIQESLQNAEPKPGKATVLGEEDNERPVSSTGAARNEAKERTAQDTSSQKDVDRIETKDTSASPPSPGSETAQEKSTERTPPSSSGSDSVKAEVLDEGDDEEDGLKVIYPHEWKKEGENKRKGPYWYLALPLVYLPQYVDESGEATFLAFPIGDERKPIVLGFQDPTDAEKCANIMSKWEQQEGRMTGVCPIPPGVLVKQCQSEAAGMEAVILRKESLPLMPGMKLEELVGLVELFHQLQNGDFSSLQQK
ncbi:hypothetical protein BSKO_08234 [Bryopsis sp. KO-2023]|nr:hypothetical protein BSKO_08234 [Bryopsis sp. KO-2023]